VDLGYLLKGQILGLDYETTDKRPRGADLVGVGIALLDGRRWYIPVGHRIRLVDEVKVPYSIKGRETNAKGEPYLRAKKIVRPWQECRLESGQLGLPEVLSFLQSLFREAAQIVSHNLKYELTVTRTLFDRHGLSLDIEARTDCSYLAHWLCYSAWGVRHGLKTAVKKLFDYDMITFADVCKGSGDKQIAFAPVEDVARYCGDDAYQCLRVWEHCYAKMEEDGLLKDYERIEIPFLRLLIDMEMKGVKLDRPRLKEIHEQVCARMDRIQLQINALLETEVPLASPPALSELLYKQLGFSIPPVKKGKTDQIPISKESCEWWLNWGTDLEVEFAKLRLEWSELETIRARFTENLAVLVDEDGRLRANNNQGGTDTGRLSMSDPNLQNIPSRTDLGKLVRAAFVAEEGSSLIVADYSQLEPRITAHFSGDSALCYAYNNDKDVYLYLVELMKETVGLDRPRSDAKVLVLAMNYGMAPWSLQGKLNVNREEAQQIYDAFTQTCKGVFRWKNYVLDQCKKNEYVKTITGRRRYLPDINFPNSCSYHTKHLSDRCGACKQTFLRRLRAERQAVNTIIQGTAADIVKLAMRNIHNRIKAAHLPAAILFQVHDEIVLEAHNSVAEQVSDMVKYEMENVLKLRVPLKTEPKIVERWSDAK